MFTGLGGERLWLCPSLNDSANDISGNGNNGSYQGGMATIADTSNGGSLAYQFDGVNDYIDCGPVFRPTGNFSISFWVLNDTTAKAMYVSKNWDGTSEGYISRYDGGAGNLRFYTYNGTLYGTDVANPFTTSQWACVTNVYNGTHWEIYIDGVLASQTAQTQPPYDSPSDLWIGATPVAGWNLDGRMDDIRMYNRTLTQSEITHLASARGVQGGPYYRPLTLKSRVTRLLSNRTTTLLERIRSASKPTTPISIKVKHNEEPSYKAGYAKNAGESENPHLWKGLVGAWMPSLGVTGDTLRDVSGNRNHGTLTNMDAASDWVTSEKGLALDFDGSNDRVNITNNEKLNIVSDITLVAWGYKRSHTSYPYLINKSGGGSTLQYLIGWNVASEIRFFSMGKSVAVSASSVGLSLNEWFSVAGVRNGESIALFVNGIEVAGSVQSVNLSHATSSSVLLGSLGWAGVSLDGHQGATSIYNRALSPQEIQELYVDSLAPFRRKKSPIGYQPIKEIRGLIKT